MQIRNRVNKVEFLRSEYSREKKRCAMRLIGSIDQSSTVSSSDFGALVGKLKPEEVQEATDWLLARDKESARSAQEYTILSFPANLRLLAEAIPVIGLDEAKAEAILDAWKLAAKAIRKALKPLRGIK